MFRSFRSWIRPNPSPAVRGELLHLMSKFSENETISRAFDENFPFFFPSSPSSTTHTLWGWWVTKNSIGWNLRFAEQKRDDFNLARFAGAGHCTLANPRSLEKINFAFSLHRVEIVEKSVEQKKWKHQLPMGAVKCAWGEVFERWQSRGGKFSSNCSCGIDH